MPLLRRADTTCYYRLEGGDDRPALLLSHSLGQDHGMWDAQATDLSPYFRVLRYDIRGHGASPATAGRLHDRAARTRCARARGFVGDRSVRLLRSVARRHDRAVARGACAATPHRRRARQYIGASRRRANGGTPSDGARGRNGGRRRAGAGAILLAADARRQSSRCGDCATDAPRDRCCRLRGLLRGDSRFRCDASAFRHQRARARHQQRDRRIIAVDRPRRRDGTWDCRRARAEASDRASLESREASVVYGGSARVPAAAGGGRPRRRPSRASRGARRRARRSAHWRRA